MKKVIEQIKGFFKKFPYVAYALLVVFLFILYKLGLWIYTKIVGAAAMKKTLAETPNIINQVNNTNATTGIRDKTCQSVADTVFKLIQQFDQDEKKIVANMNTLQNANEVIFTSNYYRNAFGVSLKGELVDALADDWRGGGVLGTILNPNAEGGRYKDLKAFIQNSLL